MCGGDFSWQVRKIFLISESGFVGRLTYKELGFSESLKDEIPKTCARTFIPYSETQQIFHDIRVAIMTKYSLDLKYTP